MHGVRGDLSVDSKGQSAYRRKRRAHDMKTIVSALELLRPRTLDDALQMLRQEPPPVPIAGCTDVYVSLNFGTLTSPRFLDLDTLHSLRVIDVHDDWLRIGALASYTSIISSPLVQERLPILVDAARQIG